MQQKAESSPVKINVKNQELLCLSLPYLKSYEDVNLNKNQILKKSKEEEYLPLSLVEEFLLEDK